ncbi:MerR family transcriptional regulator [Cronobacter muytjensii]|uniref:MerR family transcriptional regulator n=1 Tax=Cronobacter muytjensii TaxID=413501 RepID=UPI0003A29DDA|nr:MerR family transcriptional regulator [Cronobacter muytjensii]ALB70401.1 MerR family transcriptional regulator [Cronobacter muytjensii ATCC 51329]ELY6274160.1 MerR family transcriptional regulator [Cronobacter muytjensii]ELY6346671.1 MerR family transcriptional regulator [Cronobacter muytjensii]MEB8638767.1 MerR family transcriptional regulator [Cronobacter muytjensii]NCI18303.1 MerR family transcriptional regulator [Cronobacter muytjensii]
MLLQVGELAKRAGLTVRTLHHYESLGLLIPSGRTAAGYRLYNRDDIQRLHHIQALTRMGLSLAQVRECLESGSVTLPEVIDTQIAMLNAQLKRTETLRDRLVALREGLLAGDEPDLQEWLKTLELMTMYEKWFSPDELKQLPFAQQNTDREAQWAALVSEVKEAVRRGMSVSDPAAQALATRWMETLERDTAGNPAFLTRLNEMHAAEPMMRDQTGITPDIIDWITHAFAESKLAIYQRYLTPEEFAFTREHYFDRMMEWPPLVAKLHEAVDAQLDPESEEARGLAAHWLALFESFAGRNPQTQQKFREAMMREPHLSKGTWMTPEVLGWLQQAFGALMQAQGAAPAR